MPKRRSKKKKTPAKRRRRWLVRSLQVIALLCLAAAMPLAGYSYRLSQEIGQRFAGQRWTVPSRVYSDTALVFPRQRMTPTQLQLRLDRLRYRARESAPQRAGEYHANGNSVDVYLRQVELPFLKRDAGRVEVRFAGGRVAAIAAKDSGDELPLLEIEPEELVQIFGGDRESRQLVDIAQIPEQLQRAVLAAEDAKFYDHIGVDFRGIARALWVNVRAGGVQQGGSTITQQLAKNYFLTPERTLARKLRELLIALLLELKYDKATILEIYLNEIYFGQRGNVAVNGVGEAARFYFGRPPAQLNLAEAATLAGLIRAPNLYSPHKNPARARKRRDQVLRAMLGRGWIDAATFEDASKTPVETQSYVPYQRFAPYFFDHLYSQLRRLYSEETLQGEGMAIFTTLDTEVQVAAERSLIRGLERLEARRPALRREERDRQLQGAIVVMQPRTGSILALVGGRDYSASQFNRATQARRQPGSLFKPFVVLAALDSLHTGTPLSNEVVEYDVGGKRWSPKNYDGSSGGAVTMREALSKSLNIPTVDLAMRVGLDRVVHTAKQLGISTPLEPKPALALGAFEVIPIELARAYSALAADGALPYPLSVREVLDQDGAPVHRRHVKIEPRFSAAKAYLVSDLLRSVVTSGTASALPTLGIDFEVAGKTGTTDDYRDAWFVGYTPSLIALVWVGFDDGSSIQASGSSAALPIWADLLKQIRWRHDGAWLSPPAALKRATVCRDSGKLAVSGCPNQLEEIFLDAQTPSEPCHIHREQSPAQQAVDRVREALGL